MTQRKTTTQTARRAYKERAVRIETLMEAIGEALDKHRIRHEANPIDWGYVGDLGHVDELLSNVSRFLAVGK